MRVVGGGVLEKGPVIHGIERDDQYFKQPVGDT